MPQELKTTLPVVAVSFIKSANEFGLITAGETGYTKLPANYTAEQAKAENDKNGVGSAELITMELCSLVGWDNVQDIFLPCNKKPRLLASLPVAGQAMVIITD